LQAEHSLPTFWFTVVAAATLGMFGLLGWHVYNSYRVAQALQGDYAWGLRLAGAMYSLNLRLAHSCHLFVLDGAAARLQEYQGAATQLNSQLAEALPRIPSQAQLIARARELSAALRQQEREAIEMSSQGRLVEAEALLHSAGYRDLINEFDAAVDSLVDYRNQAFANQLAREAARDRAMLLGAFVIFCVMAAVWLMLTARLRRWGAELKQEMALRERAESQLRRSQKMEALGQLAAGVAHDFNNILTAILGYVGVARKAVGAAQGSVLRKIRLAARQGTEITRSLLTFSRRSEADMGPLDLERLVRRTQAMLQETLPATVRVRWDSERKDVGFWIWGNRAQLQQVLVNLVLNACDAMPEGGDVAIHLGHIEASQTGQRPGVRIQVRDSGIGMSPEVEARIFEPFFTTKPRGQSTGLGLAIVAAIVAEHRGGIHVDTQPRAGTCFTLDLPGIPVESESADKAPPGGGLVWVFSADPYVRGLIASALAGAGWRAEELSLTDTAARSARLGERPALVVLDADAPQTQVSGCCRLRAAGRTSAMMRLSRT